MESTNWIPIENGMMQNVLEEADRIAGKLYEGMKGLHGRDVHIRANLEYSFGGLNYVYVYDATIPKAGEKKPNGEPSDIVMCVSVLCGTFLMQHNLRWKIGE